MNAHAKFINLSHRKDRLEHMNSELKKTKLKVERFEAINWRDRNWDMSKYGTMFNRTPGACGCHESQVSVMREAKDINKNAIIFEDDIIISSDFDSRLDYIDKWTKTHSWDVVWLGSSFHVNPPYWHRKGQSGMPPDCSAQLGKDCETTDDPRMIRTYGAYVTFAYIVNVNSIEKILKLFDEHLHTSIGIDWLFIKLQPQLECFSFVPGCVMQKDNMSDIGTGMTVWSGQLNNGPYVYQERMEMFDPSTFNFNFNL
jgi:GR25 family glycosyltransferase involved in LPS biosynthesis